MYVVVTKASELSYKKKVETNILYLKILNLYFNITIISQRKDKFNSVYYICYQSVIFITFFVTKNYLLDSMFDSNLSFSDILSFTDKVRALTFRYRSNPREVLLEKGVPKIYSKFTGEQPCQSAISIKLLCNFIKITLRNGCSPVNLLHILRITFRKNCSRGMLL